MSEELDAVRNEVVERLLAQLPELTRSNAEDAARTRDDVTLIIGFALMAIRFRDDRIFTDFVAWLGDVLAARHFAPAILTASLRATAASLLARHPDASVLIADAARGDVLAAPFRAL